MLPIKISTTAPETGSEIQVPADVMAGVKRASAVLESELAELTDKFNLAAEWRFSHLPDGRIVPHLLLTENGSIAMPLSFPAGTLKDDESILRNLRPGFGELGRYLSGRIKQQLSTLRKQLEADLDALN
jgi:hypothetical protein